MIDYSVSDGVCVLRLNSPPVNTITLELLAELRAAVDRANADPTVGGVIITGDGRHFSAGADVNLFREITCADDAIRISRVFQEAFDALASSAKPVVAAVAGKVMGSALELAMACHFRVCAAGSRFSAPEVNLGINPGAGGTQRLPRLIGLAAALEMLLTGKPIGTDRAGELGLVDAVCEGTELCQRARGLLQSAPGPRPTRLRAEKLQDTAANAAAFARAEGLLAGVREEIIAPRKIVEAVKIGLAESYAAGLAAEQRVFAECMATPATRNRIHLFFATRAAGKLPVGKGAAPAPISTAAVVGMGSMGTGIAHALIIAGVPVVVRDEDESALAAGAGKIRKSVEKRVRGGKLAAARAEGMLDLLTTTTGWQDLGEADVVIEAVFEDVAAKRSVFEQLEAVCRPDAIIASNTSTLSLDSLTEGMRHPERLVGMHFFNPAHRMPLVEVIPAAATVGPVIAGALALAKRLSKTAVLVANREGFLVNRIFIPYLKEAFWLLGEGAEAPAVDRAMVEFGFPMGPFALIDMAGLDILVFTDRVMSRAFPAHGCLSAVATTLVARGHLGQKTGSGVYKYTRGDYTPHRNEATEQILADVRRQEGIAPRQVGPAEITERLVLRMVVEAFCAMGEQVAQRESDIDVATVLGMGFPDFRGGVLQYARQLGPADVLARLDGLAARFGPRFAPPKCLREMTGV